MMRMNPHLDTPYGRRPHASSFDYEASMNEHEDEVSMQEQTTHSPEAWRDLPFRQQMDFIRMSMGEMRQTSNRRFRITMIALAVLLVASTLLLWRP